MTIAQLLQQFYQENNLKYDGGESDNFFELKFKLFTLKIPNFQYRKDVIHIHDIQHILYKCDTTWNGEAFVAGWEIATGLWKHFPIGMMSLWAMGFSLFYYPKQVFKGYKAGMNSKGVIDLKIDKKILLDLSILELKNLLRKNNPKKMNWFYFIVWCFISELVFLFPFLVMLFFVILKL